MLVYIDDREEDELDNNYGYDYGGEEESDYENNSEKEVDEHNEDEETYFN